MRTRFHASRLVLQWFVAVCAGLPPAHLAAQPAGGQVAAGSVVFSASPGGLTITQGSSRAIVDWQDFSIRAGEFARFVQPDAASATLNRVVSGQPSSLLGTLEANGRVFLINPNGVLIGAGARIDTAGFLASTLDVANHDFLAGGDLHFAGDSTAAVSNLGAINALGGDVFLIARQVSNAGTIAAANGTAGLAAGSEVLLTTGGNERLFVRAAALPGTIVNAGTITAATAELKAAGGNAFALAINNSGLVRATGSAVRDGEVWLVAPGDSTVINSGTLDVSSATGQGGRAVVTGGHVLLDHGARLDASGATSGGGIFVGGDYQGKNPAVPNARTTTVASGAVLRADAVTSGNGGKVIVWSDDATRFAGAISARGGANAGDGGFAEVSGKNFLDYRGFADLRATTGATGTLLLDPTNITISGAGSDLNPTFGSFTGGVFDGGANTNSTISIGSGAGDTNNTLLKQLSAANVVITTTSAGAGTGTIVVNGVISYNSANSLTLTAADTITINSAITNTGTGALTINADSGIAINANVTTAGFTTLNADKNNDGTGTLTVANNITVATGGAALNVTAADIALVFFGNLNSGASPTTITASAGRSIGLGATAGDLSLTDTELARVNASSVILNTTGLTGDVTVNGITFVGSSKPVTINAGGTVTFATGASTFSKGLSVNANDGIVVGADITASNGNIVLDGDADSTASPGDGIAFTGTRTLTTGIDFVVPYNPAQGSITLRNGASGANGNIASAALNLRAADNITISDDLTATGGTFSAIANNPGGADYLNSVTGRFTIASGKTLATATSGNIDLMASKVTLDGSLNSVGTVSITGSRNTPVNLGSPETQVVEPALLVLSDAALGRITATGLTIGVETTGLAAIYMKNLTAANTDQFGPLTLTTPGFIGFEGTSVVGNRLTASGLGGIVFYSLANLSTSTAVTGDPDLTLSGNNIMFNSSVTVTAGGTGTLSLNPTNTFVSNGNLTLESGDHLELTRALTSYGTFTFNADKNNDGVGTFTVPTGIAVTTTAQFGAQSINITAADVVLVGSATLNSNAGPTKITASAGRSAGLGATVVAGGLNLDGAEFEKITATGFTLTSAGNITVDGISEPNSNKISAITTLTANGVSSAVAFANNASTFNALTVNSTTTIANNAVLTLDTGNLVLNAGSTITQTGAIEIGTSTANLTGTTITLAHADNTMGAITVNTGAGDVSIGEDSAISIAAITRTSGNLTLNAAGDITQTGAIRIATGAANLTAANITLTTATNVLGAVTVNAGTGNVALTENDAIAVAAITHTGTLNLTAAGAITSSGAVVVSGTTTLAAGSANDITLANANDFSTVVVTSGKNVTLNDTNALALGNVTAAGSLLATAGGDLTLNSGAAIAATGAVANPLVLVAGANFVNNSGAAALNAGSGRWLVYSTSPAGSTENGLTAVAGSTLPRLYNKTFAGNAPATIAAGNHLIYSTQPTLTLTAADATRTYGSANPSFTATTTGFVTDDGVTDTLVTAGLAGAASLSSLATATSPVSSSPFPITVAVGSLASSAGYGFSFADGSLTITPVTLTYTATLATRLYGASNPTFGGTVTGFVNNETQLGATTGTLAFGSTATVASNVGSYAIDGSGLTANNGNYLFTQAAGNATALTINPATLTYTATLATRLYGASNPTFGGTVTGFVNNETQLGATTGTLAFGSTATVASNVGSYAIDGSGLTANNGNYLFTQAAGNATALTINPATLTYTATPASRYVGVANPTFGGTVSGFVNGESQSTATTGTSSFATPATVASPAGSYAINGSGLTANNSNYLFVQAASNATAFTIGTQVPLTITADGKSKTYGAVLPTFTATFSGFVNGDTASSVTGLQFSTTATVSSNVGSYTITPFGATAPASYLVGYVPGTLTINPAMLTYTATTANRLYGAGNPTFGGSVSGFVNSETLGGATTGTLAFGSTATAASNVGNYVINGSGLTANNGNYLFTQAAGNATALTINPATLTYTATPASRYVGVANPTFGGTVSGFVNGESLSTATTGTSSFATPATVASPAGSYAINGSGLTATNGNYLFVQAASNATAFIIGTQVPLTITADGKSKTYGAVLPTFTATFSGFVNGDTASSVTGLQFSTTATVSSNVGSYTITPFGATAPASYLVGYVPGTLTINPAALTLMANNATRVYGAANPAFGATYTGFVNGDTSSDVTGLQFNTPATPGSNVGSYAITPSGASAANYTITPVPGVLGITPAPLTITATNASRTYGAANPAFGAGFSGFVNGETPAVVSGLAFTTPATSASGIGNYAILPAGATAANYALTFLPGTLTINRASLTLTATNAAREFGAPNPPFTGTFSGFVNGDTPAAVNGVAFGTPATATSAAGDYAITPSGATAANYTITFVNGTLHVNAPRVTVGSNPVPVVVINQQPAVTPEHALVNLDGRLTLISVNSPNGRPASLDGELARTLGEITNPADFTGSSPLSGSFNVNRVTGNGAPNLGNFELVSSSRGSARGSAQINEPGLYRESSVNMGGFNVIYHEAVADARQQAEGNTALGSSYREFTEDENPQLNLVRARVERKPSGSTGGGRSPGGAL